MKLADEYVPVFIDKVRMVEGEWTARIYFFVISIHSPGEFALLPAGFEDTLIGLKPNKREELVHSISWSDSVHHCLLRASLDATLFRDAEDIRKLFDFFYDNDLDIESEYLSCKISGNFSPALIRGQVYRLRLQNLLGLLHDTEENELHKKQMIYSFDESQAFEEWSRQAIEGMVDRYRKNPENNLRTRFEKL